MSNLRAYLDHCKRKLERNMHDIKMNSAVIVKLFNLPVTRELIEETGLYKLIRNLCKREDEMGEKSLMVYKKWRKFYGDGILPNESIPQSPSKPPPANIEPHRNIVDPLSKCQNAIPFQRESKPQSISKPDPKHHLSAPFKPELKHQQSPTLKVDSKHPFPNLLSKSKHQPLPVSKSEPKHPPPKPESKHPHVPVSKHQLSSPSKPESKHVRGSPSKPKHPFSSPSKSDSKLRPAPSVHHDKHPQPLHKPDAKHQPSSHPKPELRHFAPKLEPTIRTPVPESKPQHAFASRPDPKQRLAHPGTRPELKHPHISAQNQDFRHRVSPQGYKPSPSFAGKIRESNPSLPLPAWHEDRLSSGQESRRDFGSVGQPPAHRDLRPTENHHPVNPKTQMPRVENHFTRHKPSVPPHPAFAPGGHTTTAHQKTVDKPIVHHDVNSFDASAYCTKDEKPSNHFDAGLECGLDVFDTPPGHQRNNEALIGQESRSSFGSENPEASLDITNGEKSDGALHLDELDTSPSKRVFVEPYAIAMREGMFRAVRSKEKVPANILRLQQVYDREIMAGRPRRPTPPKGNEEKNSKKPVDQTKSSGEGPSTPSKTKKPSSGTKGTPPKPKPSSEPRPEAGQSSSNGKIKASEEDKVRISKESRKWMRIGETDEPFHPQKMRKTHHQ